MRRAYPLEGTFLSMLEVVQDIEQRKAHFFCCAYNNFIALLLIYTARNLI